MQHAEKIFLLSQLLFLSLHDTIVATYYITKKE